MSILTVMTSIGFIDQCSGVGSAQIEGAGVGGVYLDVADCVDHHQRGADIPDTRDVGIVKLQARYPIAAAAAVVVALVVNKSI